MAYPERQLEKIIKEYCVETGTKFTLGADGWMFTLEKNGKRTFVMGYKFGLNNTTSSQLCDDKSALSVVLDEIGFPCVLHHYIESPNAYSRSQRQIYDDLEKMLKTYGELVIKPNVGSGGKKVFRCKTEAELHDLVDNNLSPKQPLGVCKFERVKNEYRVICLNGQVKLVYRKQRPFVVGDGTNNLKSLIELQLDAKVETDKELPFETIPKKDEIVCVSWKHNLGLGAKADTDVDEILKPKLMQFALDVANAIDICFASIDIIELETGELKIMEVNSGIMMEKFSASSPENYQKSKQIYSEALSMLLD